MAKAVRWDLIADPRGFQRGFREANRSADTFSRGIKRTAGLIGAAFAGVQVAGFLKDAITEAREAAKVTRQTNAVIKATGGVANVSAKDVDRLATTLSKKVGVDDEVIAAGQNMLLTFKGVRDEVGKGNDIFGQTTEVALDMTAALNQGEVSQSGLEQTTMRLGKALNDPIKGISALTRVGVTFTEGQKDQIKKLVETGDKMGAQKIILGELKSEFEGAAEASADPWSKVGVEFDNIKERIGNVLLPALNSAATFITGTLIPAAEKWWKEHGPAVKKAFDDIVKSAKAWWEEHGPEVVKAFEAVRDIVDEVWQKITKDYLPGLQEIVRFTDKELQPEIDQLTQTWKDNKDAILGSKEATKGLDEENKNTLESFKGVASFLAGVMAKQVERLTTLTGLFARAWSAASRIVNVAITKMVVTFLEANRTMIRGAATVAEALHLPMAKGLRKAEQRMGGFVKDFNHKLDQLNDEGVKLKVVSQFNIPGMSVHDIVGKAAGGPLEGPGPRGKDSMLFRGAPGEHVWTDREVTAAGGHGAMERWRKAVLAGDLPGFERGGAIHPHLGLPPTGRVAGAISGALDRFARAMERTYGLRPQFTGGSGAGFGSGSWTRAIGELRREGVPYSIMSTFRAGARTHASGSVSFHSLNRAVDLSGPNMLRIWQALTDTNPTELIYSAAPVYKSRRGWSPINRLDPITRADHWNHVHAAYDKGGFLPPGTSIATNTTGKAEAVGFDYDRMADAFVRALEERPPAVYLDRQKVSRAVRDGDLWEARR